MPFFWLVLEIGRECVRHLGKDVKAKCEQKKEVLCAYRHLMILSSAYRQKQQQKAQWREDKALKLAVWRQSFHEIRRPPERSFVILSCRLPPFVRRERERREGNCRPPLFLISEDRDRTERAYRPLFLSSEDQPSIPSPLLPTVMSSFTGSIPLVPSRNG